jgi:hypothetical protein
LLFSQPNIAERNLFSNSATQPVSFIEAIQPEGLPPKKEKQPNQLVESQPKKESPKHFNDVLEIPEYKKSLYEQGWRITKDQSKACTVLKKMISHQAETIQVFQQKMIIHALFALIPNPSYNPELPQATI